MNEVDDLEEFVTVSGQVEYFHAGTVSTIIAAFRYSANHGELRIGLGEDLVNAIQVLIEVGIDCLSEREEQFLKEMLTAKLAQLEKPLDER